MQIKGFSLGLPGPADTIDGEAGGFRAALASEGIGYEFISLNGIANNLNPNAQRLSGAAQLFNGQSFTADSQDFVWVTYDLSRYGIPDGQIVVGGAFNNWTWNPGGPNKVGFGTATYYQTLFNRKLEIKFGYLQDSLEFVEPNLAGSLAITPFGPQGSIPIQGGTSTFTADTPGVNVKWNIGAGFYDKIGVSRAVNPAGVVTDVAQDPVGLNFNSPNAGMLTIDEFGYKHAPDASSLSTFVRVGGAYNTSNYQILGAPVGVRGSDNNFAFALADQQLLQPSPTTNARRGLYAGFSLMYAPPLLNTVSQYYEGRVYYIGPFSKRPDDIVSFVYNDTVFSSNAVTAAIYGGKLAHGNANSYTVQYNAHITKGIYAAAGLSYIDHPTIVTYTPTTGSALNLYLALNLFF